jgi:hypothetical protein
MLSKPRFLFKKLPVWKSVSNNDVKVIAFDPLPELSSGKFFPVAIPDCGVTMRGAGWLCYFDRADR